MSSPNITDCVLQTSIRRPVKSTFKSLLIEQLSPALLPRQSPFPHQVKETQPGAAEKQAENAGPNLCHKEPGQASTPEKQAKHGKSTVHQQGSTPATSAGSCKLRHLTHNLMTLVCILYCLRTLGYSCSLLMANLLSLISSICSQSSVSISM